MAKKLSVPQELSEEIPKEVRTKTIKKYKFIMYNSTKTEMIVSTIPDEFGERLPINEQYPILSQGDTIEIETWEDTP